jgi:Dinucleotide-utilizing enzymes involved in molybdopterin and thiamine biosynthesis family 2
MAEQDEQTRKYDRQLRLWGAHGQAALMRAHILLVGAGPAGTEALKNLVLPGVGRFTVLDGATVGPADRDNNFFVEPGSEGKSRAAVTAELLSEMNDERGVRSPCRGPRACAARPAALIHRTRASRFVIATSLRFNRTGGPLGGGCAPRTRPLPLVVARAGGLLAYLRWEYVNTPFGDSNPKGKNYNLARGGSFPPLWGFS